MGTTIVGNGKISPPTVFIRRRWKRLHWDTVRAVHLASAQILTTLTAGARLFARARSPVPPPRGAMDSMWKGGSSSSIVDRVNPRRAKSVRGAITHLCRNVFNYYMYIPTRIGSTTAATKYRFFKRIMQEIIG